MVTILGKAAPSLAHRHPALSQAGTHVVQLCLEDLETALLVETLGDTRIAFDPSPPLPYRDRESSLDDPHSRSEAVCCRPKVAIAEVPGILGRASDCPRPP